MAGRIRLLIVDDSAIVRRLISEVAATDPAIEVVGTARHGKEALELLPRVRPDVVTLDIEMPEMDGLAALGYIRAKHPRLPVIMCSSLTERGADATFQALGRGANDYVPKPANMLNAEAARIYLAGQLLPKIHALHATAQGGGSRVPTPAANAAQTPANSTLRRIGHKRVEVVVVAVSTGGPPALAQILAKLPANLPVPILIVQHMPPVFTARLADRLAVNSLLPVIEAKHGDVLEPSHVYVAPGDFHMETCRLGGNVKIRLHQQAPENSCRPAADVLFRSVATAFGPNALALVLTGMGQDGLAGCHKIREAGGRVWVQDQATSIVWGMPGVVAKAGIADRQIPLPLIPTELRSVCSQGRSQTVVAASASLRLFKSLGGVSKPASPPSSPSKSTTLPPQGPRS